MSVGVHESTQTDWVQSVLFDRGYLARIRGEAIKVYLAVIEAGGGEPDRSVTISLNQLTARTRLSVPTVIDSLAQLERLGLVVSTTRQRGKVKSNPVRSPSFRVSASVDVQDLAFAAGVPSDLNAFHRSTGSSRSPSIPRDRPFRTRFPG